VAVTNNGPGRVWVNINAPKPKRAPLAKGECLEVDLRKPVIKAVYLKCPEGETAAVRLWGLR